MFGVLSEVGKAPLIVSYIFLSNSGAVKNFLSCSILSNTLVENWATGLQLYRSNASLKHLTMIIIVSGDTTVR